MDIHVRVATPNKGVLSSGPFRVTGNKPTTIPIKPELTKWFFNENPNEDIPSLCEKFLESVKKLVYDAQKKEKSS